VEICHAMPKDDWGRTPDRQTQENISATLLFFRLPAFANWLRFLLWQILLTRVLTLFSLSNGCKFTKNGWIRKPGHFPAQKSQQIWRFCGSPALH
jgi:hypothetical protein